MLLDTLDVRLVAPAEVPSLHGASAMGSIAARVDDDREGTVIFPYCSGFLVSPVHVLTAAHCARAGVVFNQRHVAAPGDLQKFSAVQSGPTVRLVFEGKTISSPEDESSLERVERPLYSSELLDFAVFALPAPSSSGYIDLALAAREGSREGEELVLYGYPSGMPLSQSSSCHSAPSPIPGVLLHDCDSLPGSSGGLLMSASRGIAVAMHQGSLAENNAAYLERTGHFESPCDVRAQLCAPAAPTQAPACFDVPTYNRALDLGALVRHLEDDAPSVWAALRKASSGERSSGNGFVPCKEQAGDRRLFPWFEEQRGSRCALAEDAPWSRRS
jgi:V8-like Glu-specific endopeptidase